MNAIMENKKAFTLVEVLIVACLIALMATIAIPNLLRARVNANETAAQAALKTIANAMENYYTANTAYPTDTTQLFSVTPPYLNADYFSGVHNGFSYVAIIDSVSYTVHAIPQSASQGTASYTVTTGGIIQKN